jgi:hypothetical protein
VAPQLRHPAAPLEATDPRCERGDPATPGLNPAEVPLTECLKDTVARVLPFWNESMAPAIRSGKRVLVAAHGNSIRALVKYLDNISDDDIVGLNIPNGIPLVYELDADLRPIRHYYLGDAEAAAKRRRRRGQRRARREAKAPKTRPDPAHKVSTRAEPRAKSGPSKVYIELSGKGTVWARKLKIAGWVSVGVVAGALTTVSLQTVARGTMAPLPLEEIQQLAAVFGMVKTDYVEPVDDKKLITDAISGMVSSLDPHSQYFDKKSFKEFREGTTGRLSAWASRSRRKTA